MSKRIEGIKGNISILQQTANSLTGRISDAEGNITSIMATVSGLQTQVTNIENELERENYYKTYGKELLKEFGNSVERLIERHKQLIEENEELAVAHENALREISVLKKRIKGKESN